MNKWDRLRVYFEDREEEYLGEAKMYSQNENDVWANPDELAWGSRCKANAFRQALFKMKRMDDAEELSALVEQNPISRVGRNMK